MDADLFQRQLEFTVQVMATATALTFLEPSIIQPEWFNHYLYQPMSYKQLRLYELTKGLVAHDRHLLRAHCIARGEQYGR